MKQLPIELAKLTERYEQLVADAGSGALGRDDAYRLLGQLTVVDAGGAQWGLDDEGGFTRRMSPAEQPVPADPATFITGAPPRSAQPPARPGAPLPRGQDAAEAYPVAQPQPAERTSIKDDQDFTRHTRPERQARLAVLRSTVLARPGIAIVAGLLTVALLLSLTTRGSRNTTAAAVAATTTSTTAAGAAATPAAAEPGDADVTRALTAMTSDPAAAASVVLGAQDPVQVAQWRGLLASGLQIKILATTPDPAGTPVAQQWAAVDASAVQQAVFSVTWVLDAGIWKLQGWPVKS